MAAKHVKPVKKDNLRLVRQILRLTLGVLRLLRLAKDIRPALENTGQGDDDISGAGAEGWPDAGPGMDWGFFDHF